MLGPRTSLAEIDWAQGLHEGGKLTEAIAIYRKVLATDRRNFKAAHMLGIALSQLGQHDEAVQWLRKATQIDTTSSAAQNNLGHALLNSGKAAEALGIFKSLTRRIADYENAWLGLVQTLVRLQRSAEAEKTLTAILPRFPRSVALYLELGAVKLAQKIYPEALLAFEKAARLDPSDEDAMVSLANCFAEMRHLEAAEKVLSDFLNRSPRSVTGMKALVDVLRRSWQSEQAAEIAKQALKLVPDDPELRSLIGRCLVEIGRNEEAESYLRDSIARGESLTTSLAGLAQIKTFKQGEPEVTLVDTLLGRRDLSNGERASLLFTKSKIHDDLGNPGLAVKSAITAKSLSPPPDRFDEYSTFIHAALRALDSSFFASRRVLGNPTDQPVFIVGMPRSGTSITEQIIASHSSADGSGELATLPAISRIIGFDRDKFDAFWETVSSLDAGKARELGEQYLRVLRLNRKPEALRITDKMPHNFHNIWLIALLFPNARIIRCVRNPVDVCVSIFLRNFNDAHWYARDLATLGKYYGLYEEQVAHWKNVCGLKWYDSNYEDLVADPEPNIRKIVDFLGLPWDNNCLAHTETQRSVHTFSQFQVRQPIYTSSVERWRKYAPYIKPLLRGLGLPEG